MKHHRKLAGLDTEAMDAISGGRDFPPRRQAYSPTQYAWDVAICQNQHNTWWAQGGQGYLATPECVRSGMVAPRPVVREPNFQFQLIIPFGN